MKERAFNARPHEVRAILEGKKSQTRRVVKPQLPKPGEYALSPAPDKAFWNEGRQSWWFAPSDIEESDPSPHTLYEYHCPYGQPGDRLWVREKWGSADRYYQSHENDTASVVAYAADRQAIRWDAAAPEAVPDYDIRQWNWDVMKWKPSIHMPRWASRISLEIVSVRVERVQDITDEDARAEGVRAPPGVTHRPLGSKEEHRPYTDRDTFEALWDAINGKRYPWESNCWVWVVGFRKV